jgi:putative acetyltransferase
VGGETAAFCHLHPLDHISLLYTAARFARQGLATAVYRAIEAYAREHGQRILTTDASRLSRPFFEREGFIVRRTEQTCRQGVYFERYQMEKVLLQDSAAS